MGTALMAYTRFILDIVADSVEKSRKSEVVANLPKHQRNLRFYANCRRKRFRTVSVESDLADEIPRVRV